MWLLQRSLGGLVRCPFSLKGRLLTNIHHHKQAISHSISYLNRQDENEKISNSSIAAIKDNNQGYRNAPALLDKFDRFHTYLRISLTERCNLRCQYCMPEAGVTLQPKHNLLTVDESLQLARIFVELGVIKIRLTGGEPTIRSDIIDIIGKLKEIPDLKEVSITTNGLLLTRNLVFLQRAGLDGLNISLDSLKSSRFETITRRQGWSRVVAGIDLAIQLGYRPKINCVLMRNFNDDEIMDFVRFTEHRNCIVRFIEYMPFTGNKWQTDKLISYQEILEKIRLQIPELERLNDGPNDTSKAYRIPGYRGELGFITSMTNHFCGTCNRLRLTADGNLKVCLFGNKEFSLRDALRSGKNKEQLVDLISMAVKRKKKQHAEIWPKKENSAAAKRSWMSSAFSLSPFTYITSRSESLCPRYFSQTTDKELSHVDVDGQLHMVDVSRKQSSTREASGRAIVDVGAEVATLIHRNEVKKGDVLAVARLAGIMAAKRTSELIPLCHNIVLSGIDVSAQLNLSDNSVVLVSNVRCLGQTGVEMEALTAVTMAALTVYDMCKAIHHGISIREVHLLRKTGGKSSDYRRDDDID